MTRIKRHSMDNSYYCNARDGEEIITSATNKAESSCTTYIIHNKMCVLLLVKPATLHRIHTVVIPLYRVWLASSTAGICGQLGIFSAVPSFNRPVVVWLFLNPNTACVAEYANNRFRAHCRGQHSQKQIFLLFM